MKSTAAFLVPNSHVHTSTVRTTQPLNLVDTTFSISLADGQPVVTSQQQVFEPIAPDTSVLVGMASITALCALAFYVWQEQVVPVSRTNLALSKRSGQVKQYLDELAQEDDTASVNATLGAETVVAAQDDSLASDRGRSLERWLFADWLNQRANKLQGNKTVRKEPALPILKEAKWNSGDNPVLAATGLIGICVVIASLTERVFQ